MYNQKEGSVGGEGVVQLMKWLDVVRREKFGGGEGWRGGKQSFGGRIDHGFF